MLQEGRKCDMTKAHFLKKGDIKTQCLPVAVGLRLVISGSSVSQQ